MSRSKRSSALRAPVGRVAFVTSNAIGDTLVSMVIVRNLIDNGIDVTVYGTPAHALRHWFPGVTIVALPHDDLTAAFAPYDTIFQMQWNQPLRDLVDVHPHVVTLHDVEFGDRPGCMAQRYSKDLEKDMPEVDLFIGTGEYHRVVIGRLNTLSKHADRLDRVSSRINRHCRHQP